MARFKRVGRTMLGGRVMDYLLVDPKSDFVQALASKVGGNSLGNALEEPTEADGVHAVGAESNSQPFPPASGFSQFFISRSNVPALLIPGSEPEAAGFEVPLADLAAKDLVKLFEGHG